MLYARASSLSRCTRQFQRRFPVYAAAAAAAAAAADRPVDQCLVTLSGASLNLSRHLGELPGQRYTPDQQCQLFYGQQAYYCGVRLSHCLCI